jgi:copper(I)-binding protein
MEGKERGMTGSTAGLIVVVISLAAWIAMVFYADAHPAWPRRARSGRPGSEFGCPTAGGAGIERRTRPSHPRGHPGLGSTRRADAERVNRLPGRLPRRPGGGPAVVADQRPQDASVPAQTEQAVTGTRWNRRLLLGAVALLVPALAGCEAGFNAPTLQFHPAAGTTVTTAGIAINNAFVLGPPRGSVLPPGGRAGIFLALYTQKSDRLLSVSAPGTATSVKLAGGPVTLAPQTLVTLTGPVPQIVLTGLTTSLSSGQTVTLVLNFANAGLVALQAPVEPRAYDYATFSPPAIPPEPTPKTRITGTPRARASASTAASPSP